MRLVIWGATTPIMSTLLWYMLHSFSCSKYKYRRFDNQWLGSDHGELNQNWNKTYGNCSIHVFDKTEWLNTSPADLRRMDEKCTTIDWPARRFMKIDRLSIRLSIGQPYTNRPQQTKTCNTLHMVCHLRKYIGTVLPVSYHHNYLQLIHDYYLDINPILSRAYRHLNM